MINSLAEKILVASIAVVAINSCATSDFRPSPPGEASFVSRAITQEKQSIAVSAAVPSPEEVVALFGIDLYAASRDIKDLIRRGIVHLRRKGGRVYELTGPGTPSPDAGEAIPVPVKVLLETQGAVRNKDLQEALGMSRSQATWQLRRWVDAGLLVLEGLGRGARYRAAQRPPVDKNA